MILATRATAFSMNLSKIDSCTSARDGQVQTSPLLNANSAKPSSALSRNASSLSMTSAKKMLGDLPPNSNVIGMIVSAAYCMICRPVVVSPVKAILAIRGLLRERRADLGAVAEDDVEHAWRQHVADHVHEHGKAHRRVGCRFDHDAVARGERRRELPRRHQQREVPRDDLTDDPERLLEVIGDGVVVDLAERCLPPRGCRRRSSGNDRPTAARPRSCVSRIGLPLSRVSTSSEQLKVVLDPVGDLVQEFARARQARSAPI